MSEPTVTMQAPRSRLPVELLERIIDAAARFNPNNDLSPTQLLPRSKLHLFRTIVLIPDDSSRIRRLMSILTANPHLAPMVKVVVFTAKPVQRGAGYGKPHHRVDAIRRNDGANVYTGWPGLEGHQSMGSRVGPQAMLLDAFLGRVVGCLPALHTLRTHVIPTWFDMDLPRTITWRRNLASLSTHTIVVVELDSVTFRSSRDLLVMLGALRSLRVLRCTEVSWGYREPPEWLLPQALGLTELELDMIGSLISLPPAERLAWTGGVLDILQSSASTLEQLTLDEGTLQLLCGSAAQATRSPPDDHFAMPALHTIRLDLNCQYHAASNIPFLFTGRLPARRLRTLVIDVDPCAEAHIRQAATALDSFATELEGVLCGQTYTALDSVVLPPPGGRSRREGSFGEELRAWQELVRGYFPMLHERGILRF